MRFEKKPDLLDDLNQALEIKAFFQGDSSSQHQQKGNIGEKKRTPLYSLG